jgi:hypothetical protein
MDEETLVSQRIFVPWKLKRIITAFPPGCVNRLKLRFFYSPDGSTSPTGQPPGVSLLQDLGQVDYLIGDGIQLTLEHEVQCKERGSYLKVYAYNTDYFDHAINVQMIIEVDDEDKV